MKANHQPSFLSLPEHSSYPCERCGRPWGLISKCPCESTKPKATKAPGNTPTPEEWSRACDWVKANRRLVVSLLMSAGVPERDVDGLTADVVLQVARAVRKYDGQTRENSYFGGAVKFVAWRYRSSQKTHVVYARITVDIPAPPLPAAEWEEDEFAGCVR